MDSIPHFSFKTFTSGSLQKLENSCCQLPPFLEPRCENVNAEEMPTGKTTAGRLQVCAKCHFFLIQKFPDEISSFSVGDWGHLMYFH